MSAKSAYEQFHDCGFLHISNFDFSYREMESYPSLDCVPNSESFFQNIQNSLGLTLAQIGIEIDHVPFENKNSSVTHITPVAHSPKSFKSLRGHTDGAFLSLPGDASSGALLIPELIILFCIRNPEQIATTLYPLDNIKKHLSATTIAQLRQEKFHIDVQDGWSLPSGYKTHLMPKSILANSENVDYVRFSHSQVLPLSKQANQAFQEMIGALEPSELKIELAPGDLLVIHNQRCIHGRSSAPTMNSSPVARRWLLRFYGKSTPTA